jgi:hypothetical protein
MGLGNLKRSIVQKLALRWLRGEANEIRSGKDGAMKKTLQLLDGWKLMIGTALLFGAAVYDAATGSQATGLVGAVLGALNWAPEAWDFESAAKAAGAAVAVIGFLHKLYKAGQQARAGTKASALLSTEGYIVDHEISLYEGDQRHQEIEASANHTIYTIAG